MKMSQKPTILIIVIAIGCCGLCKAEPMGTAFVYEGQYIDVNRPAEGLYDFQFTLYDDPDPNMGMKVGYYINEVNELEVSNGSFTVVLDFSLGNLDIFNGEARWLEVAVRPGELNDPNEYTILSPRYEILPVPYALYAKKAGGINIPKGAAEGYVLTSDSKGAGSWQSPTGDDLGNHTAARNIKLNGYWLSGDGADEGIYLQSNGYVGIGTWSPNASLHISDESDTPGQVLRIGDSGAIRAPRTGLGGMAFDTYRYLFPQGWNENMVITGLGYVGIGTSTPSAKLEVNGDVKASKLDINGTVKASELALNATSTEGDITSADRIIGYNDLRFYGDEGDIDMRIRTDGNVGIGTSSPDYKLDVNGTIRGNYLSPSDVRLKKEIETIDNALERVTSLRGANFRWVDEENGKGLQMGVIAQEVEEVFPEAVSVDEEGYKSVAYGKLIAPLIEAMKELKEENDLLKQKVEALEKNMQQLVTSREVRL